MPRYIEQLNENTTPATGDWLWIVDVSAGATDQDRKLSVGKLALLATANVFTAAQTFSGSQKVRGNTVEDINATPFSVSTTAVQIVPTFTSKHGGALIIVTGPDFIDLVLVFQYWQAIVISSAVTSAAVVRTYSTDSHGLRLTMASGTHDIWAYYFQMRNVA